MKRSISHAAMALALTLGAAGATGVATPAYAQKQPKLDISKEFQPHAVAIQESINGAVANPEVKPAAEQALASYNKMLNARDDATRSAAQAELAANRSRIDQLMGGILAKLDAGRPTLSTADDKFFFGQMEQIAGGQLADFAMQRDGYKRMIDSGKVAPAELPKYNYVAGQAAYNAGDFASARTFLQTAVDGGFVEGNSEKLLIDSYLRDGMTDQGLAKLKSMIDAKQAAGQPIPEGWAFNGMAAAVNEGNGANRQQAYDWGMLTLQTDSRPEARGQAYKIVEAYSPSFTDDEQLDLLRLMARDNGITEQRQALAYIEMMQPLRRPGEAKTFTDRSSVAPASNAVVADAKRVSAERYDSTLRELNADAKSASGNGALAIADTYLGYGKAVEAEALYRKALETGATDKAKAQLGLGMALSDQGKYAEAKQAFAQVTTGNRASLAKAWSAYADMKAGA